MANRKKPSMDSVCYLITNTISYDDIGNTIKTKTEDMCFCTELPIISSEFLKAGKIGIKSEKLIILNADEYSKQTSVRIDDVEFKVYRDFPRDDGYVELYLEKRSGV